MFVVSQQRSVINERSCLSGAKCSRKFGYLAVIGTDVTNPKISREYERGFSTAKPLVSLGWSCEADTVKTDSI